MLNRYVWAHTRMSLSFANSEGWVPVIVVSNFTALNIISAKTVSRFGLVLSCLALVLSHTAKKKEINTHTQ